MESACNGEQFGSTQCGELLVIHTCANNHELHNEVFLFLDILGI